MPESNVGGAAIFGFRFSDPELLEQALTHASFANENGLPYTNERMEFLGDAVLQLYVSECLFEHFPDDTEGDLSSRRAALVCESALDAWGRELGIPGLLKVGKGLKKSGGAETPSICSNAVEAVLGALFMDSGEQPVRTVIRDYCAGRIRLDSPAPRDPKTMLQELLEEKKQGTRAEYLTVRQEGPPHAPLYFVKVSSDGRVLGEGRGRTIKEAERQAAAQALKRIQDI